MTSWEKKLMNNVVLSQTDPRWSAKPYPKARVSTVGGCGCGLLACVHVARQQESKASWTPDNLRSWMVGKGYAVTGQGTRWEGITETLKHIGHKSVVRVYDNDPMSKAWNELNKGNRIGVILFNGRKAPNGVQWTTGGHYVAFNGYRKAKDGRHMFHTLDSGWRKHSAWYSYEKSMRGCISKMWIVERITEIKPTNYRPSKPYKGKLPAKTIRKGDKNSDVRDLQMFLNWCVHARLKTGGACKTKTDKYIRVFQKTYGLTVDGVFGSKSIARAKAIVKQHRSKAEVINDTALELAWPAGTPVAKYRKNGGSPNPAFKKAWKKYFPKKKINTGCHSYVSLVLRASGYPTMSVKSWSGIMRYLRRNFKELKVNFTQEQLKPGDIRVHRTDHGWHIWVIVDVNGKPYRAEAVQGTKNDRYAHLTRSTAGNTKRHKGDWLFRAK